MYLSQPAFLLKSQQRKQLKELNVKENVET